MTLLIFIRTFMNCSLTDTGREAYLLDFVPTRGRNSRTGVAQRSSALKELKVVPIDHIYTA